MQPMNKHNKFLLLISFWFIIFLINKDLTLTEEIKYCFDKLEGAPQERCGYCYLSRDIYDSQTFTERWIFHGLAVFCVVASVYIGHTLYTNPGIINAPYIWEAEDFRWSNIDEFMGLK